MKALLPLTIFLTLGLTSCSSTSWRTSAVLAVKLTSVQTGEDGRQRVRGGSGVPVACYKTESGTYTLFVLTCRHVVEDGDLSKWWAVLGNDRYLGKPSLIATNPAFDVALLVLTVKEPCDVVPLADRQPAIGSKVWAIGYPKLGNRVITSGYVGQRGAASAPAFPGNSGGALVDSSGRLVGLVQMIGYARIQGQTFLIAHDMRFVPVEAFLKWLKNYIV